MKKNLLVLFSVVLAISFTNDNSYSSSSKSSNRNGNSKSKSKNERRKEQYENKRKQQSKNAKNSKSSSKKSYSIQMTDKSKKTKPDYTKISNPDSRVNSLTPNLQSGVKKFSFTGELIDVNRFFRGAAKPLSAQSKSNSTFTIATRDGVYTLLNTPENKAKLKGLKAGDQVRLSGKSLKNGSLLNASSVRPLRRKENLSLTALSKTKGKEIELSGTNMCQSKLELKGVADGCEKGSHVLKASDGQIYHYLPQGAGGELIDSKKLSSSNVKIKGRVFPGNYIEVETYEVK